MRAIMLFIEKWHRLSMRYCFVVDALRRTLEPALSFRPVRGAGTDVKEKRTYVRTPRYPKGETISDGRQWGFKWRPQWYQLHAGIEFNWIEGMTRGALLYRLRPTFCNHLVVDFSSFHVGLNQPSSSNLMLQSNSLLQSKYGAIIWLRVPSNVIFAFFISRFSAKQRLICTL